MHLNMGHVTSASTRSWGRLAEARAGKLDCVHKSPGNLEKLKISTQYIWDPCCVSSVPESSPALCNLVDRSPSGSSVHQISQARILEWVAIFFSRGSSRPTDQTHISCIGRWVVYHWPTWKARIWGGRPEMLHFCRSPGDRDATCLPTKPWRAWG